MRMAFRARAAADTGTASLGAPPRARAHRRTLAFDHAVALALIPRVLGNAAESAFPPRGIIQGFAPEHGYVAARFPSCRKPIDATEFIHCAGLAGATAVRECSRAASEGAGHRGISSRGAPKSLTRVRIAGDLANGRHGRDRP
jgi:hypothetical protein